MAAFIRHQETTLLLAVILSIAHIPALADVLADCELQDDLSTQSNLSPISIMPGTDFRASVLPYIDSDSNACSDTDERPQGLWREVLFSRTKEHSCSDSALALHQLFGVAVEGPPSIDWTNSVQAATVRNYVGSCVTTLGSVSDPNGGYGECRDRTRANILTYMLDGREVDRLLNAVGDFGPTGKAPECVATIVGVASGEQYLVTAAHCVIDAKSEDTSNRTWQVESIGENFKFRAFSGWTMNLDLSELSEAMPGVELSYYTEDVAFFQIPSELALPSDQIIPITGFTPEPFTPIYIIGRNPYLQALNEEDGVPQFSKPKDYISITFDSGCVMLGSREGHLYHNCQSQGGMSGGPILVFRDQRIYLAGVHTGGERNLNDMCGESSVPADNYGIGLQDSDAQ